MFYKLSKAGYEFIKTKITKLNKIAVKLEQPEIIFETIKREVEFDAVKKEHVEMYSIMCIGDAPKLKDWKFMATLEFTPKGNLFNYTYDFEKEDAVAIPERFRTTPFTLCEDCHVERYRTKVFVLFNPVKNVWMQVGSTCLGSFLGVKESEVHELAEFASTLATLASTVKKWDAKANSCKKNAYGGYPMKSVLIEMIRKASNIWKIRMASTSSYYSTEKEFLEHNSGVMAINALKSIARFYRYTSLDVTSATEGEKAFAEKIYNWFQTADLVGIDAKNSKDRYNGIVVFGAKPCKNMEVLTKNLVCAPKHFKLLSFAFRMYLRNQAVNENNFTELYGDLLTGYKKWKIEADKTLALVQARSKEIAEERAKADAEAKAKLASCVSTCVGEVGKAIEKVETVVETVKKATIGSQIVLRTTDNNLLYWACPYYYNVGNKIVINKAMVTAHNENDKVTTINNVSFRKIFK